MDNWTHSQIESPTGANLRLYSAIASGAKTRGVVHINHGMGEHAGRYQRFAAFLNGRGYHVYAHDHRGHGGTVAVDAPSGQFAAKGGWQKVLDDVHFVNSHIHEQHGELPVICFGHSMGSIISFNHALRHPDTINALCCWNAGFSTGALAAVGKVILKIERMLKGGDAISHITHKLTFGAWNAEFKPNRTDFDCLSRDEAEVDKYVADPLCGIPISVSLWLDVLEGVYFNADDTNLKSMPKELPVHLLGGTKDPISEHGKAIEAIGPRLKAAGLRDVTLKILPDTRHESLNEINRDETMKDYADWLDQRFK